MDPSLSDYYHNKNAFQRRILFLHAVDTLQTVRSSFPKKLSEKHLPSIREEREYTSKASSIYEQVEQSDHRQYSPTNTRSPIYIANKSPTRFHRWLGGSPLQ